MPTAPRHTLWSSTLCRNGSSTQRRPAVMMATSHRSERSSWPNRTLRATSRRWTAFSAASSWASSACMLASRYGLLVFEQELAVDVRLRELLIDPVVAEMEFQVTRGLGRELVVRERIEHPAFLRHLQVVELRQVEIIRGSVDQALVASPASLNVKPLRPNPPSPAAVEQARYARAVSCAARQRVTTVGNVAAAGEDEAHLAAGGRAVGGGGSVGRADQGLAPGFLGYATLAVGQLRPVAALIARESFALVIVQRYHGVAAAFAEVAAHREVDAVGRRAGGAVEAVLRRRLPRLRSHPS